MKTKCSICGRELKTRVSRVRKMGHACEKKYIEELNKGQISFFEEIKPKRIIKGYIKI